MIPADLVLQWRQHAPWAADRQVEQDLVIARALVELFSRDEIASALAFRGGTALHKLYLRPAARYSEDIDLVQTAAGAIGPVLDAIHRALDPWLGKPKWKQSEGRATLIYRYTSEDIPRVPMKLKVEINTREHFTVFGLRRERFEVRSPWFTGSADVPTYALDELLGTKLRALHQRKKGRDLFDLALALRTGSISTDRIVTAFLRYIDADEVRVTREAFEDSLTRKMSDAVFAADMDNLLRLEGAWDIERDFTLVLRELVARLP